MKRFHTAALLPALLLSLSVLAACGEGEPEEADDPTSESPTDASADPTSPTATVTGEADDYPSFGESDYTYVLEQICYCPLSGPVQVTVEDGEVTEAVTIKGTRGTPKGSDAPDYQRLTIDDIIGFANDPKVDQVDVTWPEDSPWPTSVAIDQIENAVDDEVTYLIRKVEITE